ncbi:MAG TPA: tetratricopeptide repeat protein [Gaiellaceae bacterium]|nr:tetratricopeptide repeat protein [Gaiellaceae bacterium]
MSELPRGTVTFLFTDIEGSTRLLDELGAEAYGAALAEHRRVLRDAFERHGGVEVDTQGDAFFVAFPTAPAALEAACEAQGELDLPVRMGLHTGTPLLTEEGYVGTDVHRAARIAAAGHGRQVLVSAATAALVGAGELRDLGEHRLKDLSAPERIFQLGEHDFPSLKTLHRSNLPVPATPFLGREHELAEVRGLLGREDARLLTLTGAGGSGKTRLALQAAGDAADAYPDGVWWVPLAPLTDAADVGPAAVRALGGGGTLTEIVDGRRLLLLLDNFEHLVEAAPEVAAFLAGCPQADVLVTSRERLRIQGEQVYPVPVLERAQAKRLFVARAQAAQPDFEPDAHVEELCERLDDLPLALELAAARVPLLTTAQLVERLRDRLDLLRGGRDADPRQATLRTTIEWSHDLLDDDEKRLFRRLAAFAGGCTLEGAEEIADADLDTLQTLLDKSLVRFSEGRYWMLGTIREFASERLAESGEADEILGRLATRLLVIGESALLTSESEPGERPELVRPELDNFRTAIDWARDHDPELALRLAVSLELFWVLHDPFDGARRLAAVLETDVAVPPVLRAQALRALAEAAYTAGDPETASSAMAESFAEFERIGDERGIAILRHRLGVEARAAGDLSRARHLFEASLATCRRLPNPKLEGDCMRSLARIEWMDGNLARAEDLLERSIALLEQIGHTWLLQGALLESADLARDLGQMEKGEERAREGLRLANKLGDRQGTVYAVATLAQFSTALGRLERAGRLWGALEAEAERAPVGTWESQRDETAETVVRDDPEFEKGREVGRALSLDDAVAYGLSLD